MPQLTMPNVGEGVTEGTVTRWLKQEGDEVALDEPVVEVETDKAVVEIPSPFAGILSKILVQEGDVVPIGTALAEFGGNGASPAPPAANTAPRTDAAPATVEQPSEDRGGRDGDGPKRTRRYSPVVLKLAAEHSVDLELVRGTGVDGRVTRQDVQRYLENPVLHTMPPSASAGVVGVESRSAPPKRLAPPSATAGPVDAPPGGELTPLTATRRTIAARMLDSQRNVPVAWMAVEADVTELAALRSRVKEEFQAAEGVSLTYLPFFVRAIVGALREHPALNATYSDAGVFVHRRYDIGIAVAAATGLVVPVVRDAGDLSIAGLAREIDRLGAKAHARTLTVDEMRGATFTVDNTGAFGSLISQPIVPPGQVAIITTEAVRKAVRAVAGDAIAVRSVMNLAISFDHRALDGAEAGRFMVAVKERLEAVREDQPI